MDILRAASKVGNIGAHIAPSLSLVEIALAVLQECESDTFVLSKGHGALGYYAAMHQLGMITDEQFDSFEADGGDYPGQPSRSDRNGIVYSGGSLGMGLSYAEGLAYIHRDRRIFALMGDGELNEGSVWEAAALAARHNLSNLTVMIDQNNYQSDGTCESVMAMDLAKIWDAYGRNVVCCDGHDMMQIRAAICNTDESKPTAVLARTVKGKGVSFMERNNAWHHNILKQADYEKAVQEITSFSTRNGGNIC